MQAVLPSSSAATRSARRLQGSPVVRNSERNAAVPPGVVALFLVRFDVKRGYVFDWQKTASSGINLDMVEFKAFPSGLHHSKQDVIYFTHGEIYSGVSVYQQLETDDPFERFSRMYSIGVLVPGGTIRKARPAHGVAGRLGRSWGHVEGLKSLLSEYTRNPNDYGPLETYYSLYGMSAASASPSTTASTSSMPAETALYNPPRRPFELSTSKLKGYVAASSSDNDADSLAPSNVINSPPILPKSHPAHSLPSFLDTFGPLVFKVWKAALARERILVVGDVPIEQGCHYVYDIALLANIPNSIAELLPIPAYRIRPLYAIGLYDLEYIKSLSSLPPAEEARQKKHSPFYGWIAYTTDKILQDKRDLYDVVIKLPPLSTSMHATGSAASAIVPSQPGSPQSSGHSALYFPINETSGRILYPVIYYNHSPKTHLKASIRDMRRFQSLEAQIGYSIDPRHRWYRQYYDHAEAEEQANALERRRTSSSGSSSGFSAGRVPPSGETMALLAASQEMTAAADEDEIYNDDPELFFSTKTDLQTEQPSWKQLTWLGFLWWASAGEEARIDEEEIVDAMVRKGLENNDTTTSLDHVAAVERDTRPLLLDDSISASSSVAATPMPVSNEDESLMYISPFQDLAQLDDALLKRATASRKAHVSEGEESEDEIANAAMAVAVAESSKQVAIIAFFHRFTARIFSELARLIQEQNLVIQKVEPRRHKRNGGSHDDAVLDARQTLWISKVDMLAMGLDPWSESDSRFVSTIVERWWGGQIETRRDNEFLNSVTCCC
ncbi:hypothetical protein POJ06DRAFT_246006 [Lipomyces tetrasporus]|uniref:DUF4484 domain-containing protein n=1 Tax=Lipomyces tetrasporus TaxID=54092 RepID=A0AAD7VW23_9ASCO|nr:uncharacterized protein POJ06DRAFT_246006 [Lipomyces tetrasporus]KAJ8102895.1 hypothetical protein POJ06DRAFT_246006 [Lipomyces tetrasporus]